MNYFLNKLKEFDDNVTVGQILKKTEEENKIETEKSQKEIEEVKTEFENSYAKYIKDDELFGRTLNVIHFKDFDRSDLDEDWEAIYTIEAEVLCFAEMDIYTKSIRKGWCDGSFSAKELREMTKITEQDYQVYLNKFENIKNQLKELF